MHARKMRYANMQHNYTDMTLFYVSMQQIYVVMQLYFAWGGGGVRSISPYNAFKKYVLLLMITYFLQVNACLTLYYGDFL